MGKCGFLTGWAIPPEYYSISSDWDIIDSTRLCGKLSEFDFHNFETLAGFSFGAILALSIAQKQPFKRVILLSPTFSFCQNSTNPFGIKTRIVDGMISALEKNPSLTLSKFYINCGMMTEPNHSYKTSELIESLTILRNLHIPAEKLAGNPELIVVHGKSDSIIHFESGKAVADFFRVPCNEIPGAHISPLDSQFMRYFE